MTSLARANDQFVRLPGLFRRFELERVIGVGVEFRIESAGSDCDGTELLVVYRKEPANVLNDIVPDLASKVEFAVRSQS